MSRPLAYWCCGGDLIAAHGLVLDRADAGALHGLHLDEARAAAKAGDDPARRAALRLAGELSDAVAAADRWRRAGLYAAML